MKPLFIHAHERPLTHLLMNRAGDLLFSCGKDNSVFVRRSKTGERIGNYDCGNGVTWQCDVTYDSQRLAVASADLKVAIFDVSTGVSLCKISTSGPCKSVEWNRHFGKQHKIVIACDEFSKSPKCIQVIDVGPRGDQSKILWKQSNYTGKVTEVHWGPFDETIWSTHTDGKIFIWDAETGEPVRDYQAHDESVTSVSFDANRQFALSTSSDQHTKLWNTMTGALVRDIATDRPLNTGAISPLFNTQGSNARNHIICGGGQAEEFVTTTSGVQGRFESLIYNIIYSSEVGKVQGHFGTMHTMCWYPDGGGFVSGGADGYARLYRFDQDYWTDLMA